MNHYQIIDQFYTAFRNGAIESMLACYHEQVQFEDPAFGKLNAEQARAMWTMLLQRGKGNVKIEHFNITTEEDTGSAEWIARYPFGKNQRPVVNHIKAQFKFENQKIINHHDHFDIWKWSSQALGLPGKLFGWTPFMKKQIQKQSLHLLQDFQHRV